MDINILFNKYRRTKNLREVEQYEARRAAEFKRPASRDGMPNSIAMSSLQKNSNNENEVKMEGIAENPVNNVNVDGNGAGNRYSQVEDEAPPAYIEI